MADLKMVYEKDAPLEPLKGKTVAVLGFGSQGHAHSLNLRDSGVKVIVANRKDSSNGRLAIEHGFQPVSVEEAVQAGDLIIVTLPDEVQPEVYTKSIAPHLKAGKALGTTHGFNVHFKTVVPPKDVDVLLIAQGPRPPGSQRIREGRRRSLSAGHPPKRQRQSPRNRPGLGTRYRRRALWHHRNHFQGRMRNRPVRRTSRPVRRACLAHQSRLRDADRSRVSAGDGVLRVRA